MENMSQLKKKLGSVFGKPGPKFGKLGPPYGKPSPKFEKQCPQIGKPAMTVSVLEFMHVVKKISKI